MIISKINFTFMVVSFMLTVILMLIAELISIWALKEHEKSGQLSERAIIWVMRLVGWGDESTKLVTLSIVLVLPALVADLIIR